MVGEITEAAKRIAVKKAPGPDGIPAIVIKTLILAWPEYFMELFQRLLQSGEFPRKWKHAKLVLIEKRKDERVVGYRPICLLNVVAKVFERIIANRLGSWAEENEILSPNQFGFRKGRSTIQAMDEVKKIVEEVNAINYKNRKFCMLVTLDIRNAFNCASWSAIRNKLREEEADGYLRTMIKSYLNERTLETDKENYELSCGVPQGSVLGPLLWNLLYDDVLRENMPSGVTLLGFADDTAVVVVAKDKEELKRKTEHALERARRKIEDLGLTIAAEKTEAVLLCGRRKITEMNIKIGERTITTSRAIRYLGVWFGKDGSHAEHIAKTTRKASVKMRQLERILPNVDGPRQQKRRLLAHVVSSVMLYAAPIWAGELNRTKTSKRAMESVHRRAAVRTIASYRTVSHEAVQVLAGIPPIDLIIQERIRKYRNPELTKEELKGATIREWKTRWETHTGKAEWTKSLIKDLDLWVNRSHGEMGYHLTQVLTGHGDFNEYLYRFKRRATETCRYCDEKDKVKHTIFECVRWEEERRNLKRELTIRTELKPDNLVETMLDNSENWTKIEQTFMLILENKLSDERETEEIRTQNISDYGEE